jgi:hypothetical protein
MGTTARAEIRHRRTSSFGSERSQKIGIVIAA